MSATVVSPERPAVLLNPRSLRERDAALYTGFSASYLRNLRTQDMRRRQRGEGICGPKWVNFGTAVRYYVEDLDAWLDRERAAA